MKQLILSALFTVLCIFPLFAQYEYESSAEYPFGRPNPEAPQQIKDFGPMIGECECTSITRNQDQTWAEPTTMIWRFKYIMNGWGVQDETLKEDGLYSGSIRQFIADSSRWYVHYYSHPGTTTSLPTWEGNLTEEGKIILYKDQTAPNGMEGKYKITFYDMSDKGYKWLGEWVTPDESFSYPTWKIECFREEKE